MSIVLEGISKHYDRQGILSDLSLEIQTGELFVLLGASGSGKSTLLRIIAGLTTLEAGCVSLHGRDVTALPPQERGVGFVFQNYSLFQHMSVADNIGFALDVRKVRRQERDGRVAELLALIGMEGFADRLPAQLSGGQQQRIALARALAHKPEVLLLDEPFGALDTKIRVQLRQNLRAIQDRLGVTTILVTHDQDEAFELADRIGIIAHGQLLEIGAPDRLYHAPRHRYTATFLGTTNLLHGAQLSGKVRLGKLMLDAPILDGVDASDRPVDILLRPEAIKLGADAAALRDRSVHILGEGIVRQIVFAGALERVQISLTEPIGDVDTIDALLPADDLTQHTIAPGSRVWVGFERFHVLPADLVVATA